MRFVFRTSYRKDMGLFRDPVQRNWYVALLVGLLALPFLVPSYLVDISLVFIYGLCGLSLMVLAGYTMPTSTSRRTSGCRGWCRWRSRPR